jgi:prophage antirepressor-like protein
MYTTFNRICGCCGASFTAKHVAAKWCSSRCSMRAYQRRRRGAPEADPAAIQLLQPQLLQPEIMEDPDELPLAWREAAPEPITALPTFAYDGRQVRVMTDEQGVPWFVAADVLGLLALDRKAMERLDSDERGVSSVHTPGGYQSMTTVNESGLYSLILGSRKPEARAFKRWVTHDVLPSIRRTGSYSTPTTTTRPTLPAGPIVHKPGIVVLARSKREAATIWHEAVQDAVRAALTKQLGTDHRTDAGLPMQLSFDWLPVY